MVLGIKNRTENWKTWVRVRGSSIPGSGAAARGTETGFRGSQTMPGPRWEAAGAQASGREGTVPDAATGLGRRRRRPGAGTGGAVAGGSPRPSARARRPACRAGRPSRRVGAVSGPAAAGPGGQAARPSVAASGARVRAAAQPDGPDAAPPGEDPAGGARPPRPDPGDRKPGARPMPAPAVPDYKINRIDELLPWNTAPAEDRQADD